MNASLVERLRRHVQVLAGDIGERHVWRAEALAAAAHYVEQSFARCGYEVRRQCYETVGMRCMNLEAEAPGSDGHRPLVVVGAHYDTVPGSPGADDNASGVSVLLEIARGDALGEVALERTLRRIRQRGSTVLCIEADGQRRLRTCSPGTR